MTPHEQDMRIGALRLVAETEVPEFRQDFYDYLAGKTDQAPPQIIHTVPEAAMSLRLIAFNYSKAAVIQVQNGVLVAGITLARTNDLHQVKGDPCNGTATGHINAVCHHASLRGCFAFATIAEAGEAASLSSESTFRPLTLN